MTATAPVQTAPSIPPSSEERGSPGRPRIKSLDIVRGGVMALMALDHVRVFMAAEPLDDLSRISAPLFLARWVTHFCAPAFLFLAGTGAFFHRRREADTRGLARFLLIRGVWLVLLELTVVRLGWTFNFHYDRMVMAGVIWAIGICMILMAGLVLRPARAVALLGLAIVAGHNLLDPRCRRSTPRYRTASWAGFGSSSTSGVESASAPRAPSWRCCTRSFRGSASWPWDTASAPSWSCRSSGGASSVSGSAGRPFSPSCCSGG
jgi:uncharacterized membrane protein